MATNTRTIAARKFTARKPAANKAIRKWHLITVSRDMGPFKTLAAAKTAIQKINEKIKKSTLNARNGDIRKLTTGYIFTFEIFFFTRKGEDTVNAHMREIEKSLPSAKVTKRVYNG